MNRRSLSWVLAGVLLAAPAQLAAQRFAVTPILGYRIGGNFPDGVYTGAGDSTVGDIKLTNGIDFGLVGSMRLTEFIHLEVLLDHQASELKSTSSTADPAVPVIDVGVNYLHGGLMFEKPGTVAPFFAFGLGATFIDPKDQFDSQTNFSGSFALGARTFFNERFGARFEGRLYSTNLGKTDTGFCRQDDCYVWPTTTLVTQVGLTAGLVVGF